METAYRTDNRKGYVISSRDYHSGESDYLKALDNRRYMSCKVYERPEGA